MLTVSEANFQNEENHEAPGKHSNVGYHMRRIMSITKLILIVMLMSLSIGTCSAPEAITLKVDGKKLITSPLPTIRNGRVYVPITAFRKMGLFVNWKYGEHSGTVAWIKSDLIYDVTAGRSWVPGQIAGSKVQIPETPFMSGNQLMVSLRTPVSDTPSARNFQLEWNAKSRTANVCRSKKWLEKRLKEDTALKAAKPSCYETPI